MSATIYETVGRYERAPKLKNEWERKLRQNIKEEYAKQDLESLLLLDWKVNQRADWRDLVETKADYKRFVATKKAMRAEVHQGHKATVMVRQRALQVLLAREEQQYESELAVLGKAFHKQRL